MAGALGNNDPRVSQYRKCWIQGADGATICGVYGLGTSREITANWIMPFEGESVGGKIGAAAAGAGQVVTGMTLVQTLNTRQTWQANQPTSFTLELILYALEDAVQEVMKPLQQLEKWIAPDAGGMGSPPDPVLLNIGTKAIYKDVVINSMSHPLDKEVDSQGNFVRATVMLQLSTLTMVSKDMLNSGGYGIRA